MVEPHELFPEVPNLYEFPSVHADMLFDELRVDRYWDAIAQVVRSGDIVADIGTGTGLLAFLSLQAGARHVYAIERSPAIRWAKVIAERNGYLPSITFVEQDSRAVRELPEPVDIIVSELIGHIAFEEGMIESLFHAKEHFLRANGTIIPRRVELVVALVSEREIYPAYIDCWKPIRDVDYTVLREQAIKACYLTSFSDRDLLSLPRVFFEVDFHAGERPILSGSEVFTVCRTGQVNGVAMWFNATLAPGIELSSSPWTRTHWVQCFAPLSTPIEVEARERLAVELNMHLRQKPSDSFSFELEVDRDG